MTPKPKAKRLDDILVERGLFETLDLARAHIMAGEVFDSRGQRLDKAGGKIPCDTVLDIRSNKLEFASRGGYKLEHALKQFGISVQNKVCLDIGASTGGFTDCLLKSGAREVFAVDVGYGLLLQSLRQNPKVKVLENTNARTLKLAELSSNISIVTVDVSFISLQKIVEPLWRQFTSPSTWILLFKPQFEVGPENLLKGGIVKDPSVAESALVAFRQWAEKTDLKEIQRPVISPLPGKKSGNVEYLLHYEGAGREK